MAIEVRRRKRTAARDLMVLHPDRWQFSESASALETDRVRWRSLARISQRVTVAPIVRLSSHPPRGIMKPTQATVGNGRQPTILGLA